VTTAHSHEFSRRVLEAWRDQRNNLDLTDLAVTLDHREAFESASREAFQDESDAARRVALLELLARTRNSALLEPAVELVQSAAPVAVRRAGLDVLARFEDSRVTATLLTLHAAAAASELHPAVRSVLLSRPSSAREWLAAVDRGDIDPNKIPVDEVRQIALLGDAELDARVAKHWGQLRSATPGEKLAEVRRLNNDLRARAGVAAAGKVLFTKHCASCHTLFGEGTRLGPDLTSANRKDRDFLLISLVDPDAVIRKEYVSLIVRTTDGRLLTGVPVAREDSAIVLADGKTEQPVRVAVSEVDELHESPVSLMPADLYRQFDPQQLRDLFHFLQSDADR
jgi:putative heme-binding domain-containing protein